MAGISDHFDLKQQVICYSVLATLMYRTVMVFKFFTFILFDGCLF